MSDGVTVVIGRTLDSARHLIATRPELAGAVPTSPMSHSHRGTRTARVFAEKGLEKLSPARAHYARRVAWCVFRDLRRIGSPEVVHVIDPAGGPAKVVAASDYLDWLKTACNTEVAR